MKTLSLSVAKMKLSALVETLQITNEEVVITKNGQPAAALLVSPEEFEGWQETIAVKNDADLMMEIKRGLAALKKKKAKLYTLNELFG